MKVFGRLKFFDLDRGFGFIARDDGRGEDIYLDARAMRASGIAELRAGDHIAFGVVDAGGGRSRATRVELLAPVAPENSA